MHTSFPTPPPAPTESSHDLVVTGRHSTPHRELAAPFVGGGILLFETPAASVLRIPPSDTECLVFVPLEGAGRFFHDGIEVPADGLSFSHAGRGGIFRTASPGAFAVLRIRQSLAENLPGFQHLSTRGSLRVAAKAQLPAAFRAPSGGRAPVLESRSVADLSLHAAAVQEWILLSPPDGAAAPELSAGPRRSNARAVMVHFVWETMRADLANDRPLEEWSRIVGTSPRTLEYAFSEIAGLSPMAFIRVWRFSRARALLLGGRVRTVKDAAYGCGLMHLGRFSIDYRLQFGESPSETLADNRPSPPVRILAVEPARKPVALAGVSS